jgi:hypothetical protein
MKAVRRIFTEQPDDNWSIQNAYRSLWPREETCSHQSNLIIGEAETCHLSTSSSQPCHDIVRCNVDAGKRLVWQSSIFEKKSREPLGSQKYAWTTTHSFFLGMGGLAIDSSTFLFEQPLIYLTTAGALGLIELGYELPDISQDTNRGQKQS